MFNRLAWHYHILPHLINLRFWSIEFIVWVNRLGYAKNFKVKWCFFLLISILGCSWWRSNVRRVLSFRLVTYFFNILQSLRVVTYRFLCQRCHTFFLHEIHLSSGEGALPFCWRLWDYRQLVEFNFVAGFCVELNRLRYRAHDCVFFLPHLEDPSLIFYLHNLRGFLLLSISSQSWDVGMHLAGRPACLFFNRGQWGRWFCRLCISHHLVIVLF